MRRQPHRQPRGPRATLLNASALRGPCGDWLDHHEWHTCRCWHQYDECPCTLVDHVEAHPAMGCPCPES
jgi:hypothetical protein